MNWENWKTVNTKKIWHPFGFEEQFVNDAIVKLPGVTPADVFAQHHFIHNNGKNRYIDYCIRNENNLRLMH